jgi:predicted hydrocarbon binding protein
MDRKDFFKKTCKVGICSCAGLMLFSENNTFASTTLDESKEDWRIKFVQNRFAFFFNLIGESTDKATRDKLIEQLGMNCSKENEDQYAEYIGQIDKYLENVKTKWVEKAEFDRVKNEIRVTDKKRESCFCPLVNSKIISKDFCNCSRGWLKQTYGTIIGKPVEVEIITSILRGSDCCSFKITIV